MSNGLLNASGLTTTKVITEEIILKGKPISDAIGGGDNRTINFPTLSSRWDSDVANNIGWVKADGQWINGNSYRDAYDLMVSKIGINDKFVEATEGTELTNENADKFLIDTVAVKFRLPLINGERVLVVSNKTDTEWYNYYSDGWLEQGGEIPGGTETVTYPKDFIDTKYYFNRNSYGLSGDSDAYNVYGGSGKSKDDTRTINSVTFNSSTKTVGHIWQAKGRARILSPIDYNRGLYLFFKLADEVPSTVVNTQQIVDDLKQECEDFKADLEEKYNSGIFILETDFITVKDGSGNPTGQYSWYRKWSDGWVEQGGNFIWDGSTTNPKTYIVTLLEPLRDINYQVFSSMENYTATGYYPWINNKTTTSFELYVSGTAATKSNVAWKAAGYKS